MSYDRLGSEEIFSFLRPDQISALSDAADKTFGRAGEIVYRRGDPATHVYVVLNGSVALRLPGKGGVNLLVDELRPGSAFGSCVSFAMDNYTLNAQCTDDSELLRIESAALKRLLESDPRMGYAIQSRISEIYFRRYIETMKKLQAIVQNIPVDAA
jgi:CRP-like cAMP-binding protein